MSGLASMTQNQTCFTTGDPLTALLRGRLRLSPWLGTIVVGLIINIPIMLLASLNDLWFDHNDFPIVMTQPQGVTGADLLPLSLIGCAL